MKYFYKILDHLVYFIFGWKNVRSFLDYFVGYHWRGYFLGLIRYKAVYMVKPDEVVILGGVCSEDYISQYINIIGAKGKLIVVEANPENAARLKNSFSAYKNIYILNKAIWSKNSTVPFLLAQDSEPQVFNRLDTDNIAEFPHHMTQKVNKIQIPTISLDQIAQELNIDIIHQINLTINGAELDALKGMKEICKKNPELRVYINSQQPEPANRVVDHLKSDGFKVFTSNLIRTVNREINLLRIYACLKTKRS